ncbi:uncharacterized protein LOC134821085 [Bolinopsis microptera]|uniref:uncharacterized protein LOC134821085 n=1 Tax=Bolinopsis microptera TaxID=2820187 RepID=UPI00307A7975
MQFTCVVTDPADSTGATTKEEYPELRFYTITPHDRSITTGVEQTISCDIAGLENRAEVKWIDHNGDDVPTDDTSNYIVDDGTATFLNGAQTPILTIKTTILSTLSSATTYKCSVTSRYYPGSPVYEKSVVVTPIVVTAGNKEVLRGKDAVEISCKVTGLTAALQTVKWQKSDGTDVTTGETGYTSNEGSLVGDSQTTTLTVASAQNTADSTYNCLITPAARDDATEVSTSVTLNTFTVGPDTPKKATTAVAQTLTCEIGDVVTDVTVSWKDNSGAAITSGSGGYTIAQGTAVSGTKIQTSTLTIDVTTLTSVAAAAGVNPVTYQCAAESKEYPDSATSTFKDIVVDFLTFGSSEFS